ncbi:MAG: DEAD/DEAH box helicase [Gemmatimonadaceae bacterium]|nr:DEAD/DEAH box helicase [Chitinophagaceae bacterium]
MSFNNLQLIEPLLKALIHEGYVKPTPIQEQSIPAILQQRDLLGCAQTGTGKTAAFAIPLLQLMHQQQPAGNRRGIRALILTPTRELAIQIEESFQAYGKYLDLRHLVIFGGVSQVSQVNAIRRGVDILVATPGRLLDLMQQRVLTLDDIKFFVLDEADRMLDMGFVHDVKKIIAKLPAKRQTLFFSATMPAEIQRLADILLTNPVKVEVTPVSSTADTIQQSMFFVDTKAKKSLLLHLLETKNIETALVFTRTKHGADKVAKELVRSGIGAEAIHGNKSQNARQSALNNFKSRRTRVLVATDIAARGIDIDELTHVINFDLPNVAETYVHRIGRTGRAGANGLAFSFCDHEEREYLRDIQKLIGKSIPVDSDHPFPHTAVQPGMHSFTQRPAVNNRSRSNSAFRPRSNGNYQGNGQRSGFRSSESR